MIYGQDEPTLFPVADLYDSGMIQMYINAARELYNLNREDLKEFQKTFGDFVSPFAKDAQWVDANTRGRINEAMDYLQKNGIDPLRSAEGRAVLQRVINTTPRAEINIRRANAKLGEEYLKARGQMMANGTYNDDYEQYLLNNLGLGRFEDFDSSMGTWTRTSPSQFKDLNAATSSWFDDLKGEDLGLDPTGRYRLYGVDENQMNRSLTPMLPGFVHNDLGGYYYNLAKKELQSSGQLNPTEDQILDRLKSNIVTANKERMFVRADADDYTKLQIQNQYARDLENLRTQNDIYKDMITNGADENGDGKISKEERKNYSKSKTSADKKDKTEEELSYTLSMLDAGISNFAGTAEPGKQVFAIAKQIAKGKPVGSVNDQLRYFEQYYMMNDAEDPSVFAARFSGDDRRFSADSTIPGQVVVSKDYDKGRIKSPEYVMKNTLYYNNKGNTSNLQSQKEIDSMVSSGNAKMVSTGRVWTSPTTNGNYTQYHEVIVTDDTGKSAVGMYRTYLTKSVDHVTQYKKDKAGNTVKMHVFAPNTEFYGIGDNGEMMRAAAVDRKLNGYFGASGSKYKDSSATQIDLQKR